MIIRILAHTLLVSIALASSGSALRSSTGVSPKSGKRVSFNLPVVAEEIEEADEVEYPRTPASPVFAARASHIEAENGEYPLTPYHEMYPRYDEEVDALAAKHRGFLFGHRSFPYTDSDAEIYEGIESMAELGCALYEGLKGFVAEKKNAVVEGAKGRLRSAARGAAVYSIQKLFGYTVTPEDEAKISEILNQPSLVPHIIDRLHAACVTTTVAPTTIEPSTSSD
jgi:hypothetical protein